MIKTKGFRVVVEGKEYILTGDFEFNSPEKFEAFKAAFSLPFHGFVYTVETLEEVEEKEKDHSKALEDDNLEWLELMGIDTKNKLMPTGLNEAIVGVVHGGDRLVYDTNKCIEIIMKSDGVSYDMAAEFLEYNTFSAHMGEDTPVWITPKSCL